ncbi:hypothetical protein J3E72DRAFT_332279 [Bipolaris maydis]|nr:hypothetical protein J3E72DRAFT_332279 [Bipolaris maydis]
MVMVSCYLSVFPFSCVLCGDLPSNGFLHSSTPPSLPSRLITITCHYFIAAPPSLRFAPLRYLCPCLYQSPLFLSTLPRRFHGARRGGAMGEGACG